MDPDRYAPHLSDGADQAKAAEHRAENQRDQLGRVRSR